MKRDDILDLAGSLIGGDRHDTYGDAFHDFTRIGKMWGAVLDILVSPEQVALCMALVKIGRLSNGQRDHLDGWVDGCGYLALGGEIATEVT
jgi:hypothetical protein